NVLLYKGSGSVSRLGTSLRLGILLMSPAASKDAYNAPLGTRGVGPTPVPDFAIRIWDRPGMNPSPSRGYIEGVVSFWVAWRRTWSGNSCDPGHPLSPACPAPHDSEPQGGP